MPRARHDWRLMASHGIVLFYLAARPETTMREMAESLDLTERQIARIVRDLADADFLSIDRQGRRNTYRVNPRASFRHPLLNSVSVGAVLEVFDRSLQAGSRT